MLVYEDNPKRNNRNFNPRRFDPVRCYMNHYENSLFLTFMLQSGNMQERRRASIEMDICERKMKYWERQEGFDKEKVNRMVQDAKKKWEM